MHSAEVITRLIFSKQMTTSPPMTSKLALIHDNKQEPFGKHNVFLQAWEKWLRMLTVIKAYQ